MNSMNLKFGDVTARRSPTCSDCHYVKKIIFTANVCSTREDNIYTWKCLSVHLGGEGSQVQVQVEGGVPGLRFSVGGGVPGLRFLRGVSGLRFLGGGVPGLSKGKIF